MKAGFIYQVNDLKPPYESLALSTGGLTIISRFPIVATCFGPYSYS